jgi:hypothetical protein
MFKVGLPSMAQAKAMAQAQERSRVFGLKPMQTERKSLSKVSEDGMDQDVDLSELS